MDKVENQKSIVVLDKNRNKIAIITERDETISCQISNAQNNESSLTFSMLKSNEKYRIISQAENYFIADNKEYVLVKPDESVVETRNQDGSISVDITAVESYYLLQRKYVTSFNSTDNFDHIDTHMVVVLSNGYYPLYTNWVNIEALNPYTKGTAAYALFAILYGSGWNVGTVDVDGTHDLETDKKSVWDNVKQIRDFWGGILVIDSVAKTVSLRDEDTYRNYNGFQIRYGKNIKNVTRKQVNDLVTKLYVYGYQNLNIASDNDNKEYLTDFRYTNKIYEGILTNNDITNQRELKNWGIKQIAKMCQPAIKLSTDIIDLREYKGYSQENFNVNDIVDVVDDDLLEEQYQARIIKWTYDYFQPWNCSIEVGDETPRFEDKFKYVLDSSDYINKVIQPTTGEIGDTSLDIDLEGMLEDFDWSTVPFAYDRTQYGTVTGFNSDYTALVALQTEFVTLRTEYDELIALPSPTPEQQARITAIETRFTAMEATLISTYGFDASTLNLKTGDIEEQKKLFTDKEQNIKTYTITVGTDTLSGVSVPGTDYQIGSVVCVLYPQNSSASAIIDYQDARLNTNNKTVVGAINELKKGFGGSDIPSWWIDLPPAPSGWNYFLVNDTDIMGFQTNFLASDANGSIYVDWGDGTTETFTSGNTRRTHTYNGGGTPVQDGTRQYIVKIKAEPYPKTWGTFAYNFGDNGVSGWNKSMLRASINGIPYTADPYYTYDLVFWNTVWLYSCKALQDIVLLQSVGAAFNPPEFASDAKFIFAYICSSLMSITLPDNLTAIPESFVSGCNNLRSINIHGVTKLPAACFVGCQALRKIISDNPITEVKGYACESCYALTDINLSDTATIANGAFASCYCLPNLRT